MYLSSHCRQPDGIDILRRQRCSATKWQAVLRTHHHPRPPSSLRPLSQGPLPQCALQMELSTVRLSKNMAAPKCHGHGQAGSTNRQHATPGYPVPTGEDRGCRPHPAAQSHHCSPGGVPPAVLSVVVDYYMPEGIRGGPRNSKRGKGLVKTKVPQSFSRRTEISLSKKVIV